MGDRQTASAFALSWNTLPSGSVYTAAQTEDWLSPVTEDEARGRDVLELGCGNASLLVHMTDWSPAYLEGVELGDAVGSAKRNMAATGFPRWRITQDDLTNFKSAGFDLVYCIGVLHHLERPRESLDAVIRNTKPGGRFHCCVYAREGNGVAVHLIEPIRRLCSRLPWQFTKYLVATPLAVPFFVYAKVLAWLSGLGFEFPERLPLHAYSVWIAEREFRFFRHVAFDQLISPRTQYFRRETVEAWLTGNPGLDRTSTYITMRNGNAWKFGGGVSCTS